MCQRWRKRSPTVGCSGGQNRVTSLQCEIKQLPPFTLKYGLKITNFPQSCLFTASDIAPSLAQSFVKCLILKPGQVLPSPGCQIFPGQTPQSSSLSSLWMSGRQPTSVLHFLVPRSTSQSFAFTASHALFFSLSFSINLHRISLRSATWMAKGWTLSSNIPWEWRGTPAQASCTSLTPTTTRSVCNGMPDLYGVIYLSAGS